MKPETIRAYQAVLNALNAANTLRDEIDVALALDVGIPDVARKYAAQCHWWLYLAKEKLEDELGLSSTIDQYGNPLDMSTG